MTNAQKVAKLSKWLENATKYTTEELTNKTIGECYYRFATPYGPSFDITTVDHKPVVVVTAHGDPKNHFVKDVTSIGQFTDPEAGESYRIIIRLNDEMELLNERCGMSKIASYTFDKSGYPTAGKVFEDVSGYLSSTEEISE